jgi:50S ribosomal subunit-associated GTPase HflX
LEDKPLLTALNKVDQLAKDSTTLSDLRHLAEVSLAANRPDTVLISAKRGLGLDQLVCRIAETLARAKVEKPGRSAKNSAPG